MNASNIETRVKVLYEIAMAMGNTLDEKQLLTDCLKVILRKLNGLVISFYDQPSQQVLMSLPRRGMKQNYIDQLLNLITEEKSHRFTSGFVCSWENQDNLIQYVFKVNKIGWLTLISAKPIDEITLSSLGPVCDKLATSISSCRTNQQLIEQEHNLQTALYNLKKAQQSRDSFLANMSHEIRTPLNGILGFLHQLEDTDLNEKQQHYLSVIKHSSDSMGGIINDILDFSKVDAGKLTLESESFHLLDSVTPIIELFRGKASQQNTHLEFVQQGSIPSHIKGDSLRLKQIISNLVSNAIKFSANARVTVILRAEPIPNSDELELTLRVEDTGIGIANDRLEQLGQPFAQAENSTTRNFGGTGLGLAICKGLLALMNSELKIESEKGLGSRFYFSWNALAIKITESKQKLKLERSNPSLFYPNKSILLVEDNKVNQMLMKAILTKMKVYPDIAEDGQQALEMYSSQQGHYDLVLMDINMPVMGGVESTQLIRKFESDHNLVATPIIALTANVLRGDREKYMAKQMDEVVGKPIDMPHLFAVFERFLN